MDKFARDAFNKAEELRSNKEATAWCNVDKGAKASVILAAALASGHDIVKIIDSVMKAGLEQALHEYENYLMMGGFSLGYKAGQQSMLNNE